MGQIPVHITWALPVLLLAAVATAQDISGVARQNMGGIIVITGTITATGGMSQSSGCCIDTRGYVLATAHQVAGVENLEGRLQNGQTFALTPVEVLKDWELALLKSDRPLPSAVNLGNASSLSPGSDVFSIATPTQLDFSVVRGIISNLNRSFLGHWAIQADFRVSPGSSGGPVFDMPGRLIGLVFGRTDGGQGWTVVIPINNAYALLRRNGIAVPGTPLGDGHESVVVPAPGVTEIEMRALEAYNRGVAARDPQSKADAYRLAVQLLQEFYEAHFNLAVASTAAGDQEAAIAAYHRAGELRPHAVEPRRNLGRLHLHHKEFGQAIAVFQAAKRLAPQNSQSCNDLGEAYRQAEDYAKSEQLFREALKHNNEYAPAHYNLGLVLANTGKVSEAVEHFKTYFRLAPEAADAELRAFIEKLEKQR